MRRTLLLSDRTDHAGRNCRTPEKIPGVQKVPAWRTTGYGAAGIFRLFGIRLYPASSQSGESDPFRFLEKGIEKFSRTTPGKQPAGHSQESP